MNHEPSPVKGIPLPTPFPVGPVHVYLIEGPEPTLIDTGPNMEEAWEALVEGLAWLGLSFRRIHRLIITHGHADHYGLAARIVKASGAQVLAHEGDARFIEEHPEELYRWTAFLERFLPQAGLSPSQASWFRERINQRHAGYAEAVKLSGRLRDGDELRIGGLILRVVHTPGHSPGSLCLYEPREGFLLSGDTLLEKITPNPVLQAFDNFFGERFENLVHYLESLKKLEALPIRKVLPGHRSEIQNVKTRIEAIRLKIEERKGKLLEILRGRELTLLQATERLFPDLDERQLLLALFDGLAHLDLLKREGLVEYRRKNGLILVRSPEA